MAWSPQLLHSRMKPFRMKEANATVISSVNQHHRTGARRDLLIRRQEFRPFLD